MRMVIGGTRRSGWLRLARLFVRSVDSLPVAHHVIGMDDNLTHPGLAKLAKAAPLLLALDAPEDQESDDLSKWDRLESWLRTTNDVTALIGVAGAAAVAGNAAFDGQEVDAALDAWAVEIDRVVALKEVFASRVLLVELEAALADPDRACETASDHFAQRMSRLGAVPTHLSDPQAALSAVVGERFVEDRDDLHEVAVRLDACMPDWCGASVRPGKAELAEAVTSMQRAHERARAELDALAERSRRANVAHRFEVEAQRRQTEHWRNVASGKQAKIEEMETKLKKAWKDKSTADARTHALKSQLKSSAASTAAVEAQIDAMRVSLSWRLTGPVRGAAGLARGTLRNRNAEIKAQAEAVRGSDYFDEAWYLARYTDIAEAGIDPAEHFIRAGAAEGRAPGPRFCTVSYLKRNPDVAASGINPLVHFVQFGAMEGRVAEPVRDDAGGSK